MEDEPEMVTWLCQNVADCLPADVNAVFRVMTNNAFSLDTMVLRIAFGAAFFSKAAYFNHSCAPNALSLRMGGNMAIFAQRDIAVGEELTHSYIASHMLLTDRAKRAQHLHFTCSCVRCVSGVTLF